MSVRVRVSMGTECLCRRCRDIYCKMEHNTSRHINVTPPLCTHTHTHARALLRLYTTNSACVCVLYIILYITATNSLYIATSIRKHRTYLNNLIYYNLSNTCIIHIIRFFYTLQINHIQFELYYYQTILLNYSTTLQTSYIVQYIHPSCSYQNIQNKEAFNLKLDIDWVHFFT